MPSISANIKLLIEWAPVLNICSAIGASRPGQERAIQVAKLAEFLTGKTANTVDDRLVRLVTDILLTPQGGALVDYLSELAQTALESSDGTDRRSRT